VSLDTVVEAPILPEGGPGEGRPYVIVVGNEKGGSGKSTAAMHLIVALAKLDFKLGSIDLDARQSSLSRYIANRREHAILRAAISSSSTRPAATPISRASPTNTPIP
jgi:chromosome partitioning protein